MRPLTYLVLVLSAASAPAMGAGQDYKPGRVSIALAPVSGEAAPGDPVRCLDFNRTCLVILDEDSVVLRDYEVRLGADPPVAHLRLAEDEAERVKDLTGRHIGKPLAVILDGRVLTAPTVKTAITGRELAISVDPASDTAPLVQKLLGPAKP